MNQVNNIYIQLKDEYVENKKTKVLIRDLAVILAPLDIKEDILNIEVLHIDKNTKKYIVVSILTIIERITQHYPDVKIIPIGDPEILIKIGQNSVNHQNKTWTIAKLIIVGSVLFVGTGLAIMNFHADVNMAEAHKVLYRLITGESNDRPLIMQIPYSLGIGLGMAIFFNHILPQKYNNEPSPMEVEMFTYRKNIDEYLLENEKNTEEKE